MKNYVVGNTRIDFGDYPTYLKVGVQKIYSWGIKGMELWIKQFIYVTPIIKNILEI